MKTFLHTVALLLGSGLLWPSVASAQSAPDSYASMLGYLALDSRIEGDALVGSSGAIMINQAAGDLNLQANLHSLASGQMANAKVDAGQRHTADTFDTPLQTTARIGGNALSGASGIVSINQASGSANAELNSVTAVLAAQGMTCPQ